jgi:predicted metal-dependent peptidase
MITTEEFFSLAQDLECYHGVFSRLWQMGRPVEDKNIPTAAVSFDREGNYFGFHFNPDFWKSLDDYNRKFVICHEALHLILYHGSRLKGKIPQIGNIAADVVVNESLIQSFGFDRKLIKNHENFCWLDTVFAGQVSVEAERAMEYYYEKLMKDVKVISINMSGMGQPQDGKGGGSGKCQTVDTHGEFEAGEGEEPKEGLGGGDADTQDEIDQKIDEACQALSPEEIGKLKKAIEGKLDTETKQACQAGTSAGGLVKVMSPAVVKKKSKWETVIKRWMNKYLHNSSKDKEQWARINRRFSSIQSLSAGKIFLPTEMEIDTNVDDKHRVQVMFFLDTSGSCAHLADRFWKAASSLPEDRFDIRLFCFDTQVYETSFASKKLYGFGGTSFKVIENYIQADMEKKNTPRYPDAVFLITDGYGDSVAPQRPEKWYWFLSESYKSYIPAKSNVFMLKDYE